MERRGEETRRGEGGMWKRNQGEATVEEGKVRERRGEEPKWRDGVRK